jgi:hypothetical protein
MMCLGHMNTLLEDVVGFMGVTELLNILVKSHTTLNIVFSITYYVKLFNVISI